MAVSEAQYSDYILFSSLVKHMQSWHRRVKAYLRIDLRIYNCNYLAINKSQLLYQENSKEDLFWGLQFLSRSVPIWRVLWEEIERFLSTHYFLGTDRATAGRYRTKISKHTSRKLPCYWLPVATKGQNCFDIHGTVQRPREIMSFSSPWHKICSSSHQWYIHVHRWLWTALWVFKTCWFSAKACILSYFLLLFFFCLSKTCVKNMRISRGTAAPETCEMHLLRGEQWVYPAYEWKVLLRPARECAKFGSSFSNSPLFDIIGASNSQVLTTRHEQDSLYEDPL